MIKGVGIAMLRCAMTCAHGRAKTREERQVKSCGGFKRVLLALGDVQPFGKGICVCALMFSLALGNNMVRRLKIIKHPKTTKKPYFKQRGVFWVTHVHTPKKGTNRP